MLCSQYSSISRREVSSCSLAAMVTARLLETTKVSSLNDISLFTLWGSNT